MEYNATPKKSRGSIGVVICFTALAVVLGLFAGLLLTNQIRKSNAADAQADATALATDAPVATADTEPTDDAAGSLLTTGDTSASASQFAYDGQYTRAQIVEMCAPSVVGIDTTVLETYWGQQYEATGSGSGVILTADGYIATCAHVVDGATAITVTLHDDTAYEATVVGTDSRNDLAILKIDATGLTPATIGDSDMLTVGEDVIAIGNPLGELRGTATSGIVSAVCRSVTVDGVDMELVQTDAAISPGNSGGGLFDASGKLIGLVNAKVADSNAEGLGFAIPVNSVVNEINDILNYGYITGRASLGIYTQNVTLRGDYGMFSQNSTSCVQVADVVADSAAEAADIRVGDLILAVDGTQVTSNSVLSNLIATYNAGDTATITIQRNGQQFNVSVTFREYVPTT